MDNPLYTDAEHADAVRRREASRSVKLVAAVKALCPIPLFTGRDVEAAVSPKRAVDAVRDAFLAYARGEWTMPPKVYVPAYPAGDFRAMPALGAGTRC